MSKEKEALIYGWFGHENLLDELILKSLIDLVKTCDTSIKVNVMGVRPDNISKCHKGLNRV